MRAIIADQVDLWNLSFNENEVTKIIEGLKYVLFIQLTLWGVSSYDARLSLYFTPVVDQSETFSSVTSDHYKALFAWLRSQSLLYFVFAVYWVAGRMWADNIVEVEVDPPLLPPSPPS